MPYGDSCAPSAAARLGLLQKILNESWPLRDQRGDEHARGIPDQPSRIPVDARVIWERDGLEIISGKAARWINPTSSSRSPIRDTPAPVYGFS